MMITPTMKSMKTKPKLKTYCCFCTEALQIDLVADSPVCTPGGLLFLCRLIRHT